MKVRGTLEKSGSFYQDVYSISMDDLVDLWIESFHPFGTVLVFFDVGKHFKFIPSLKITAAETTGPARQPLPTSSTPAVIIFFN